ncbi:10-epi-junenol synthase [Artemisia annua]|uniref:10-epi-junenol synthase n=1 Tax=Artemisia annua TaxID=35608 RepID=A0A2U1KQG2_ARTAN|nr:10-epi-junenol synthase [Artemisia annua]
MAANESNPTLKMNNETTTCPVRPFAKFLPSIWGDRFLSFSFDKSELKALGKAIEEPKEDVRRSLNSHNIALMIHTSKTQASLQQFIYKKLMAANESNPTLKMNNETTTCPVRPFAKFLPSIWGDRFLSFSFDKSELKALGKAIEEPKEDVRRLILNTAMDPNEKLKLIYSVYRLGLTYLFAEEIDDQVDKIFKEVNMDDYAEPDLYTVSTNFQVFRLHGYKLSCDVFNKFKDYRSGQFMANVTTDNMRAILSFYESAQLRIRGEYILDEASEFSESQLKGVVDTLEEKLARKVKHALISPFHRGLQMVEARLYFSNYEEEFSMYNSLQNLANAHFRYLQLLQKEELHNMTKWGKDMEFHIITPYSRDRKPELYLWTLAMYMEPHYSQGRMVTSKIAQFVTVLDDTYDAYATIEELRLLTNAINRWDNSAMEQLPDNILPIYEVFRKEFTEFERLFIEGSTNRVDALKKAFQELARGYHQEAEWRHSGHIPSFQEYLKNGLSTSTYKVFSISSLMGMEENVSKEALSWYETHPKILEALQIIGRLHNDVSTFEFENERAQQQVTSVDAYMKTFGVPTNVAVDELKEMIENAWKDINEGCLKPTEVSMELLSPIVNLARMTDVVYKFTDNFTFPEKTIKEYITMLFISSIPM